MDHSQHQHNPTDLQTSLTFGDKVQDAFSQYGFMPHGHCYLWKPLLVSMHVISDALIGLAYVTISVILYTLVKRTKLQFNKVLICFGVFIGACGLTHFMEIWNLWHADYWWSAWVKVVTAIASVGTGVYLFKLRHTIVQVAEAAKLAEQRRLDLESLTTNLEFLVNERTSALTQSEAKFRTITDAMPQMVWSTFADGSHDYYNKRWYEFTGAKMGSTDGMGWTQILHPEDKDRAIEKWIHSVQTGAPYEIEYRLRHHSGNYKWTLGRALAVKNDEGEIIRWMGTCTDIDDQKKTEAKLVALAESLDHAVNSRDEFLSIASHELKTPLTSLTLQAQQHLRLVHKDDPRAYEKERIDKNAEQTVRLIARLNRLVDDMLDISRIKTGKLTIKKEFSEINSLAGSVIEKLQQQFLEANIPTPEFNFSKDINVVMDPFRIEQVITNLFQNALKYGSGKPIEIAIQEKGKVVQVQIKDHGIGISKENQGKIFERFERAVSSNEVSGFGLGLYISKEIIAAHRGRIWVESEVSKGSSFIFEIPKDPDAQ